MEVNSLQVAELHKKFEDLNDEIAVALRHQEDVIQQTTSVSGGTPTASRKDVLRLATRAINWREDVNALAKHIDLQLQNSRALRSKEAQVLSRDSETKPVEDDSHSAKMRCLRSDIRMLQEFRLGWVHARREPSKEFMAVLEKLDEEGRALSELVDRSIKAEKSGRNDAQATAVVELFEARSVLKGKISEQLIKEKKQFELEMGFPGSDSATTESEADDGKLLASWDVQLYLRLAQGLLDQQQEIKARIRSGIVPGGDGAPSAALDQSQGIPATADNELVSKNLDGFAGIAVLAPTGQPAPPATSRKSSISNPPSSTGSGASLDEVNLALQKLRREHGDLKHIHAKLSMANAQLEDDLAHLQRKYEDEKRAHMNEKKWYVPKIQKLEETVLTTAKAFEALKLNVELLTNMYKALRQTVATHELEETELKEERDRVSLLLSEEIKKVALLSKENVRKDKLVMIAMSARHEMCALAKHCESQMKTLEKAKLSAEHRARENAEELTVSRYQLENAYSRFEATDQALQAAKATIERQQNEMEVCIQAAQAKEVEMKAYYEKETLQLQQRADKAKRELMDAMSQNLSLDGRLRKAQEKLKKLTGEGAAAAETKTKPSDTKTPPT